MEEQTADEYRDLFLLGVSGTVSQYWKHLTEGHDAPKGSAEDYLGLLVDRVRRHPKARADNSTSAASPSYAWYSW
jgi:hypothetical protein